MSIRLLLADDQALVRGALAALLELEADLEVVAQVGRGDEAVEAARTHAPDVALFDVEMKLSILPSESHVISCSVAEQVGVSLRRDSGTIGNI